MTIKLQLVKMNPSDWRKAAAWVTQHKQETAMAEMDQLSSMPLSQIAIDDSGPPVVHYGSHMPVAASIPTGTTAHMHSSQQEDSYQQIIPGIPQSSLYHTLSSLSSGLVASDTDAQSLSDKVTKGFDQYLQDVEQLCALEVNYFDDTVRSTNTSLMLEMAEQVNQSSQNNLLTAKPESTEEVELAMNIPESIETCRPYFAMTDNTKKHITARYQLTCKPSTRPITRPGSTRYRCTQCRCTS